MLSFETVVKLRRRGGWQLAEQGREFVWGKRWSPDEGMACELSTSKASGSSIEAFFARNPILVARRDLIA